MIISVDHGNRSIKTPTFLFTSGVIASDNKFGIKSDYVFGMASITHSQKSASSICGIIRKMIGFTY